MHAVTDAASCPLSWRLFLPAGWGDAEVADEQAAAAIRVRRARAGIPEGVRHRPKWRLALDMLTELADWGRVPPVVVADAGYGTNAAFRAGIAALGSRYVFTARTDSVVVGYSVASRSARAERPVGFGGGTLARDLTLVRLRQSWEDTSQSAAAAAAEWSAARRHRRPAAPERETAELTPEAWERYTAELTPEAWERYTAEVGSLRDWLRSVPVEDGATWARVAGETAGAFAAWSRAVEGDRPGPLAATADALARSAQLRAHEVREPRRGPSARGAALLLASVGHGGRGPVAQAVPVRQLLNTAKAMHDAHLAAGQAQRAAELAAAVRGALQTVVAALPVALVRASSDDRAARYGPAPAGRPVGSVLPTDLQRARRSTAARSTGQERGAQR